MSNYKSELVAVFGQPVAENPTGVMQEAGFAAAGLDWRYLTIEVAPSSLGDAVQKFSAAAAVAVERAVKELQQMRREAASSLVIPGSGGGLPPGFGGPGGLPGGGKIQMP